MNYILILRKKTKRVIYLSLRMSVFESRRRFVSPPPRGSWCIFYSPLYKINTFMNMEYFRFGVKFVLWVDFQLSPPHDGY